MTPVCCVSRATYREIGRHLVRHKPRLFATLPHDRVVRGVAGSDPAGDRVVVVARPCLFGLGALRDPDAAVGCIRLGEYADVQSGARRTSQAQTTSTPHVQAQRPPPIHRGGRHHKPRTARRASLCKKHILPCKGSANASDARIHDTSRAMASVRSSRDTPPRKVSVVPSTRIQDVSVSRYACTASSTLRTTNPIWTPSTLNAPKLFSAQGSSFWHAVTSARSEGIAVDATCRALSTYDDEPATDGPFCGESACSAWAEYEAKHVARRHQADVCAGTQRVCARCTGRCAHSPASGRDARLQRAYAPCDGGAYQPQRFLCGEWRYHGHGACVGPGQWRPAAQDAGAGARRPRDGSGVGRRKQTDCRRGRWARTVWACVPVRLGLECRRGGGAQQADQCGRDPCAASVQGGDGERRCVCRGAYRCAVQGRLPR